MTRDEAKQALLNCGLRQALLTNPSMLAYWKKIVKDLGRTDAWAQSLMGLPEDTDEAHRIFWETLGLNDEERQRLMGAIMKVHTPEEEEQWGASLYGVINKNCGHDIAAMFNRHINPKKAKPGIYKYVKVDGKWYVFSIDRSHKQVAAEVGVYPEAAGYIEVYDEYVKFDDPWSSTLKLGTTEDQEKELAELFGKKIKDRYEWP